MPLTARGQIYLGGKRFTTDPATYERQWPKRVSEHPGIGGSLTIQDFGRFAKDKLLTLQSGQGQYIEKTLVQDLDAMAGTKGATYTLTDWAGNQFTVFILAFDPQPTFLGTLFTYAMRLRVLAITSLWGQAYTGD
jgi:hypothetical protein